MCLQSFVTTLSVSQCHKLIVEAYNQPGGVQIAKARVDGSDQQQQPPQPPDKPNWCICGRCRDMGESRENICCRRSCVTTNDPFSTLVLNTDVLAVVISHSADHYVRVVDFNPASYRKAAYRQLTLWQHGHLGGANRRVIPSCVVLAIRCKFHAPDGVYMGFRENRADREH